MNKNKTIFATIGFLLAGLGIIALVLSLVGVQITFLAWMDAPGRLFGFVTRLIMVIGGFVLAYMSMTDFDKEI